MAATLIISIVTIQTFKKQCAYEQRIDVVEASQEAEEASEEAAQEAEEIDRTNEEALVEAIRKAIQEADEKTNVNKCIYAATKACEQLGEMIENIFPNENTEKESHLRGNILLSVYKAFETIYNTGISVGRVGTNDGTFIVNAFTTFYDAGTANTYAKHRAQKEAEAKSRAAETEDDEVTKAQEEAAKAAEEAQEAIRIAQKENDNAEYMEYMVTKAEM